MDELLITEPSLTKKVVGKVEGAEEEEGIQGFGSCCSASLAICIASEPSETLQETTGSWSDRHHCYTDNQLAVSLSNYVSSKTNEPHRAIYN